MQFAKLYCKSNKLSPANLSNVRVHVCEQDSEAEREIERGGGMFMCILCGFCYAYIRRKGDTIIIQRPWRRFLPTKARQSAVAAQLLNKLS